MTTEQQTRAARAAARKARANGANNDRLMQQRVPLPGALRQAEDLPSTVGMAARRLPSPYAQEREQRTQRWATWLDKRVAELKGEI